MPAAMARRGRMCYHRPMWRVVSILAVLAGLSLPAVPALAGDGRFRHREKSPDAPPLPKIEYYCTDAEGKRRELGEIICITASCQSWLAQCGMSANNPAWRKLQDGCPGVSLRPRQGLGDPLLDALPVHPEIGTTEPEPS